MGKRTKIGWASVPGYIGGTWNTWQGCIKKSEACKNCYMYAEKLRYGQDPTTVVRSKPGTFNLPLNVKQPTAWFTCSWSDFFVPAADEWRAEAYNIMRLSPQHLFLVLTKYPERFSECLPEDWGENGYPNVWLGVTAENQERANERIPILLNTPAAKRWISVEPMLGHVNLAGLRKDDRLYCALTGSWISDKPKDIPVQGFRYDVGGCQKLDWVIVGGESGAHCRPMVDYWLESLIEQCDDFNIPIYVKQMGGYPDKQDDITKWDKHYQIQQFPETGK